MFEKMVRQLTEQSSRRGVGDFPLTDLVRGFWNKTDGSDIEIDMVAVNEDDRVIRFGSCKRSATSHGGSDLSSFGGHVARFLRTKEGRRFKEWRTEKALYAPVFDAELRQRREADGWICRDLNDFKSWLYPN